MIGSVQIGDINAAKRVMRDGLGALAYHIDDNEGNLVLDSASLTLSNLDDSLSSLLPGPLRDRIRIGTGGTELFDGFASDNIPAYERRQKLISIECDSYEGWLIELMDSIPLNDLSTSVTRQTLSVYNDFTYPITNRTDRYFYKISDLIRGIAKKCDLDADNSVIEIDNAVMLGGVAHYQVTDQFLPDMSCREFMAEAVKMFNACWWVHQNKLYFKCKKDIIPANLSVSPIVLKPIKDTLNQSFEYVFYDQIKWAWSDQSLIVANDLVNPGSYEWQITRYNPPAVIREIVSTFRTPNVFNPGVTASGPRLIRIGDVEGEDPPSDLVIRSVGSTADLQYAFRPQRILERFYTIDFSSSVGVTFEVSLISDRTIMLSRPFIYNHIKLQGDDADYFLRGIEINLREEKAVINALRYENI